MTNVPNFDRISDYVSHWAELDPGRDAILSPTVRLTYSELNEAVDRLATALLGAGVERGDRVATYGPTSPATYATFLATASIGAIWVGMMPRYTPAELKRTVRHSEPKLIFSTVAPDDLAAREKLSALQASTLLPVVEGDGSIEGLGSALDQMTGHESSVDVATLGRARAAVQRRDPAAMVYTSGTTGEPKGALVPHAGLVVCAIVQGGHWYEQPPRVLCDLPLNHVGGLSDISTSVLPKGGAVYFMERFDADEAIWTVERERLTHLLWVPTQLLAAVQSPEWNASDLSSLQWIIWGGAAAPLSLLEELKRKGPKLGTSYGQTESTGSMTYTNPDDPLGVLSWSVGTVDPHFEVRLADGEGDRQGEVQVRGEFVTPGYFKNQEASEAAIDEEGWLRTGDIAEVRDGGHFRLVGRSKEMYKSGGYNVYPREVELALEQHPAVAIAAVVAVPDERWTEVGHAFVTVEETVVPDELERFARTLLANYKIPKSIFVVDELPKLPIGKIDKGELRRLASAKGKDGIGV
ncbi:MAG: class I adenylate-forming enzyme family protein [Solirubrobacterales bacterium]